METEMEMHNIQHHPKCVIVQMEMEIHNATSSKMCKFENGNRNANAPIQNV